MAEVDTVTVGQDPTVFAVLAASTLVASLVFIVFFAREKWWRHPFGQSVMIFAVGIFLHALAATLRQFLGLDYAGRSAMRITAQGFLLFAMLQRTYVLVREQRRDVTPVQ